MLARKNLKPLTVAGAALALTAGTLAGVVPANAEPAHGGAVNTGVVGDTAVGPACSGSGAVAADSRKVLPSAWKSEHGTAPMAYRGEPGTGSVKDATRLTQKKPGSPEFAFTVRGDHGMVNAPDGKYQLSVGDAVCGRMTTVTVKDGTVDASGNDAIRQAAGQQIVQV